MMAKLFHTTTESIFLICACAIGIYLAIILYTRISGKRSFSKMSSVDFAMTIAIGSIIASVILTPSVSLTEGLIALGAVYLLQLFTSILRLINPIQKVIDNKPILLMDGDRILTDNMKKARVTLGDLRSKLREANVIQSSQIRAVVFETTGDIAVLHTDHENLTVQDWILEDVKRN